MRNEGTIIAVTVFAVCCSIAKQKETHANFRFFVTANLYFVIVHDKQTSVPTTEHE